MTKELLVSSTAHETNVAILEDDQLVEIYIARGAQHGLAGSIYKGRVTRVLPGMQSAFVNIGLDRDAFLYVSDFSSELEELDEVADEPAAIVDLEKAPARRTERSTPTPTPTPAPAPEKAEEKRDAEAPDSRENRRDRRGRRSRRRRGRGGRFPDSKYARVDDETKGSSESEAKAPEAEDAAPAEPEVDAQELTVLPGESLAKYSADSADEATGLDTESEQRGHRDEEPGAWRRRERADESVPAEEPEESTRQTGSIQAGSETAVQEPDLALETRDRGDIDSDSDGGGLDSQPRDDAQPDAEAVSLETEEADERSREPETNGRRRRFGGWFSRKKSSDEERASEDADTPEAAEDSEPEENEEFRAETPEAEDGDGSGPDATGPSPDATAEGESDEESDGEPAEATARVRGRSGNSRYLHRRGGRRGRRRGRGRPSPQQTETEATGEDTPRPTGASITELLSAGQEILVQISKEPLGKKGARITSHIAMPGRYLVYMPTVEHVGVSRKIANDTERLRLRKVVQTHRTGIPGGFIVRTAGEGASEEEIHGDMLFLYNLWLDIRQRAEQRDAPALIHQDLDVVERVLRDQLDSDFKTVWVDSESEYERILRFVERFQPKLLSRVKLYTRSKPIFDSFNVTPELEKALRPKVWLKSGGYIVINQTEALVAIDVNTGKFVGKSDRLEDTIVKTNTEAAQEIVRQIRLRDLGGIIVVDFIDMDDRKNRNKVAQALEQEMKRDRAPSKSLQFNEFGLVAITRKRVKQSLERTLCTPCPYCVGSGFVKSIDTVIYEILSEAKKMAPKSRSRKDLTIRVNPEVARVLKSRDNTFLQEIEETFRANVLVRGDLSLHREHFDIT